MSAAFGMGVSAGWPVGHTLFGLGGGHSYCCLLPWPIAMESELWAIDSSKLLLS